jgi:hypothetical protein
MSIQTNEDAATEISRYLERKVSVKIVKSRDTGEDQYAISVNECPDFWLNAFDTLEEAILFCKEKNLDYTI